MIQLDKIRMDKKMNRKLIQLDRKIQQVIKMHLVRKIQLVNKINLNLLMIDKIIKLKEKIVMELDKMKKEKKMIRIILQLIKKINLKKLIHNKKNRQKKNKKKRLNNEKINGSCGNFGP
jgi:hypothetical protein